MNTQTLVESIKNFEKENPKEDVYIMLKDHTVIEINNYREMIKNGKINPENAYTFITMYKASNKADFMYPFVNHHIFFIDAYLMKEGYQSRYLIIPATGLKYYAATVTYKNYMTIEITNLDTVFNNLNLSTILSTMLGNRTNKEINVSEYDRIVMSFERQEIFNGYDFCEARRILMVNLESPLVESFSEDFIKIDKTYREIFKPHKICFNKKWERVDCSSINIQ